MSSAVSMFNPANMKSPCPVSITDGTQIHLTGEMTPKQVDREQDIQEKKIKLCWGGIVTGFVIGVGGIIVACIKAKE